MTHVADEICMYLAKIIYQGYKPKKYDEKEVEKYNSVNLARKMDEEISLMLE